VLDTLSPAEPRLVRSVLNHTRSPLSAAWRGVTTEVNQPVAELEKKFQREETKVSYLPRWPSEYPRLVNPYDPRESLDARARSYLHANCAQCHVEAGGGNAQMELEYTTLPGRMRLFDVKPLHDSFGVKDARLIAPGSAERSVLVRRIANRGAGQMPPLATSIVDREAVRLLEEWIAAMKPGK
jgi:mono/diheme cytochrome c family protein